MTIKYQTYLITTYLFYLYIIIYIVRDSYSFLEFNLLNLIVTDSSGDNRSITLIEVFG